MFVPPYGGCNFPYKTNLNWIIAQILSITEQTGNLQLAVNQLQNDLNDLKNGLNDQIIDGVTAILEKWKEDGTLEEIAKLYNGVSITSSAVTNPATLPEDADSWTEEDLSTFTASYFYDLYNALTSAHANNMQYVLWGNDEAGQPLAYYKWTPDYMLKNPSATIFTNTGKKPVIVVTSGVHGDEKESIISLYRVFSDWLNKRNDGNYILDNFIIYIAPCVNPYGINNNSRLNSDGIDINRNFPAGFTSGGTHGDAALSSQSAKFIQHIMELAAEEEAPQSVLFYDCHNFTRYASDPAGTTLYYNVSYRSRYSNLPIILLSAAEYLRNAIKNIYPSLNNPDFIKLLGIGNEGTLTDYADSLGIPATLIETPINFVQDVAYTNQSAKLSYLIIANSIFVTAGSYLDIPYGDYYYTNNQIGYNNADTLFNLWSKVPRGSLMQFETSSDNPTLRGELPNAYKSTLIMAKGFRDQAYGLIIFVNTGISNPRPYFANVYNNVISDWFSVLPRWGSPDFSSEQMESLNSLYAALQPGQEACIRVVPGMPIINSMPVTDQSGLLKITVPYTPSSYTKTAMATYISDDNKMYFARAYGNSFAAWQAITSAAV